MKYEFIRGGKYRDGGSLDLVLRDKDNDVFFSVVARYSAVRGEYEKIKVKCFWPIDNELKDILGSIDQSSMSQDDVQHLNLFHELIEKYEEK